MSDLTAIDILVNPDENTIERAQQWNARMRESVADGFALDATQQPHITTLQRFVRTADLDNVYAAVEKTLADADTSRLAYQAVAIGHTDWGVRAGDSRSSSCSPARRCSTFRPRCCPPSSPSPSPAAQTPHL